MRKLAVSLSTAAVVLAGAALPAESAHAATRVLRDPGTQTSAVNDLQRARMTYRMHRTVYRLKIKDLSRADTQAFVRFYRPGYDLFIATRFVRGRKTVRAVRTDYDTFRAKRFHRGVHVRWNFRTNSILVHNTRFLSGRSARLEAYTVPKGAMHGPRGHPDDFVSARVRRG
jgi:hypothetical protein